MKRCGHLLTEICRWDNLLLAFCKASRGLVRKTPAERYALNLNTNLRNLRKGLMDGTFGFGDHRSFQVRDPKCRVIHAPVFPERVAHHAIFNLCEPLLDRRLIYDSYACRKGKGTHGAIKRARVFAKRFDWCLQLDIRKFFDSIPHRTLLQNLCRVFKDKSLLDLFESILSGYETAPERGLPIGSLSSQHFANFYLSGLDRLIKEKFKIPGYLRYMDDFVLWAHKSDCLWQARSELEDFLVGLGLSLKRRSEPVQSAQGLSFLGHCIYPRRTELNRSSRTRFVRKARKLELKLAKGEITELELQQRHASLSGFGRFADMRRLQGALL